MEHLNKHNIKKSKVAGNTIAILTASVLDKLAFLMLILYFTRYIGANKYGEYLLVITFIFIFRILANFGMSRLFVRDLARDFYRIEDYLGNSFSISAALSIFAYLALLFTSKLLGYPPEIHSLIIIGGLSIFPFSIASIFESVLHALQCMGKASIWLVLNSFLTSFVSILVLHIGYGLEGVFIVLFLVNLLYACGLYFTLLKIKVRINLKFSIPTISHILKKAFPFALITFLGIIYLRMGIVILSKMESSEVVAWYGAPHRFFEVLLIIPFSLGIALFPVMSKYHKQSIENLKQSYEKALRYLIILALPLAIGISVLAKAIVVLFFGNDFASSAPVMSILAWSTAIMFVNAPAFTVILNSNYFHRFVSFYFVQVLLSAAINYILILKYSYIGAGIARLITEFVMLLILIYFLNLIFKKIPNFLKLSIRPLLGSCIVGMGLLVFHFLHPALLLVCAFLIYFVLLFILKEFTKEEISKIKSIFLNPRILFGKS